MKLNRRLEALEKRLINEPTILTMPNGKEISITGPKDYLLTLLGQCLHREHATPRQAEDLDVIQQCVVAREPGGSRIIELIKCFQHGPVDTVVETGSPDASRRTEDCVITRGQPTSKQNAN